MQRIRIPIAPAKESPEAVIEGEPTVDLPLNPMDEYEEAEARQREKRLRDIAWVHLEAAHERFCDDTEAGRAMDAYSESKCVMEWMDKIQELDGDGGDGKMVVMMGDDEE